MKLNFNAPINTETVDRILIQKKSGKNIYQTVCVLEKISQKIGKIIKNDMDKKLQEFDILNKNDLEEVNENKEQIELSKFYERLPKPTSLSIKYLLDDKIKLN
ncbi:hypothetical protein [Blattabacterium cuenoti]|uniref:hypothetical protein n=1 Tax=Blattabacterium cuenoti TaxID=1653831 RepID=UPI00163D25FC|nr:hypothetical protein [Blattabacterium cuenoti]